MSKFLLKSLALSPAVFAAALAASGQAIAAGVPSAAEAPVAANQIADVSLDQISNYGREGRGASDVGQVTSVSQLSDVKPTDWAFQALQSLVERYGCIAGYPDKTYRGNRAMTRYEFAAGLNACMDRVNELISAATADLAKKEDLETLKKLQEEFAAELATLRGRVDALEARTATLEKQQFSTTTKLAGEVIFAVTDEFGTTGNNTVFQDRVRLALNTSFTGKDLLVTRIAAGNANLFATPGGGAEGIQTFNYGNTGNNSAFVDWVAYFGTLGEKTKFYIPAIAGLHYDYAPTISPALDAFDGGTGPLSIFAQRNPIYGIGGGSGIGATVDVGGGLQVSLGYLANNTSTAGALNLGTFGANLPTAKNGLFDGNYSALGQIAYAPGDGKFQLGATYVNAYTRGAIFDAGANAISLGTLQANTNGVNPVKVDAFGLSGAFKVNPSLVVNAFGMVGKADFIGDGLGTQDIWSYGLGVALPDFGKKGNLLGLTVGAEPYRKEGINRDVPLHIEGFYKYQLNDKISVTPGIIWVANPGQNSNNDDIVIGTVRTTFTF